MNTLSLGTDEGDVEIREEELASITDAELKKLRISREELQRCFADGVKLMQRYQPGDRVRPVADEVGDGTWIVRIVGYSPLTDPLMRG